MSRSSEIAPFPATRWSLVASATDDSIEPEVKVALEDLCKLYWFPLYGFLRRKGRSPADAEDLVQAFFAKLLADQTLAKATPDLGRLRSFLLTVLKRFVSDQDQKVRAQKRGGGLQFVPLDAEDRFAAEPADQNDPEADFERRWALTVLENVIQTLEAEYHSSDRIPLFKALRPFLTGHSGDYHSTADLLQMKEATVRVSVFRLRRRYGELLREHIADTVNSPDEVAEELDHLMSALSM